MCEYRQRNRCEDLPELPDLTLYLSHLERRVLNVRLASMFLLRTFEPPVADIVGKPVRRLSRIGKQLVFSFDGDRHMVVHLMISGRLRWQKPAASIKGRNFEAAKSVMMQWTDHLAAVSGDKFPDKVTAFHDDMAVHGKYKQPCPVCGAPVQRIVYAENEANYCAGCQTDGKLLEDRSLSRVLKDSWPKRLEDLEG